MKATIIAEDFAGMRAQGAGLAEKAGMGWDFQPVIIKHSLWRHLPARYWPDPLQCVAPIHISNDSHLIISIGGTGGVIGAAVAKHTQLPIVQIQNPRTKFSKFDLIIANTHDRIDGSNILISRNALHPITPQKLHDAQQKWKGRLRLDEKPLLSILIGGTNGRFSLNAPHAKTIAHNILSFMHHYQFNVVLTPSRRTEPEALKVFKDILIPAGVRIETGEGDNNPYLGMLACSDMIAVTMDSVSMISEAISTRVPVAVIPLPGKSSRILHFIETLKELGRIKIFEPNITPWSVTPLDDTPIVAREMLQRLKL
ncbi:mitochondrial fission ELM1 family protein [Swingsia samuiensis]|uniref:Nucleoside-diphosphate sugar epimerase n=1 Tax=Swingsia samuiensis TaxID=1293412 RepID=A0A4Y6UP75_9PROT|nr:mitochondrial fission ELM1 family protein [Swingsia samuiensis]QDH17855.1 hypothetical protein E3D00_09940 [Swingsia samuiensis]